MRKLMAIGAMLALMLVAAVPATADTVTAETGGVFAEANSVFMGNDFADAEVLPVDAEAESQFLFFGDGLF
jgi:hypothetical protein